jgi:hypothetical protein
MTLFYVFVKDVMEVAAVGGMTLVAALSPARSLEEG